MKRLLKYFILLITCSFVLILLLFLYSPKPTALLVRKLFEGGVAIKPENYNAIQAKTTVKENITYLSKYENGYFDIVSPRVIQGNLPVIIWVHGGAFLGGDKADVLEYAVQIASHGYIVMNMNYALAPKTVYPTPVYQVGELYQFIQENAEDYHIDLNQVYFAGDSAGAQIASQFVNIQVDEAYRELVGIESVVEAETIKGTLLFCGPYDVTALGNIESNFLIKFIFKQVGWAYMGDKNWQEAQITGEASIIDHISSKFPATFITDGNIGSFEDQGKALAKKLSGYGIDVQSVFFDKSKSELGHEYQFMMNTEEAKFTFGQVIHFLEQTRIKHDVVE